MHPNVRNVPTVTKSSQLYQWHPNVQKVHKYTQIYKMTKCTIMYHLPNVSICTKFKEIYQM